MTLRRRQLDLFPDTVKPRPYLWRMHVIDAGESCGSKMILFACRRCHHHTSWMVDLASVSANRRGRPCPVCNRLEEREGEPAEANLPGVQSALKQADELRPHVRGEAL